MNKYICVKLKELRLEKGFNKEELALKLGISPYRLASSVRTYPKGLTYDQFEIYKKTHNII